MDRHDPACHGTRATRFVVPDAPGAAAAATDSPHAPAEAGAWGLWGQTPDLQANQIIS